MTEQHLAETNVTLSDSNLGSETQQSQAPVEKMVPQSQVNQIAHARFEAGRQKALTEMQQQSAPNASYGAQNYGNASMQMNQSTVQITPEIHRLISEEAAKQAYAIDKQKYEQQMTDANNKLANELAAKIETAKPLYPDYNEVVTPLVADAAALKPYLGLLNQYDAETVQEVLYELGKHEAKLANLVTLSQTMPNSAITAFNKIVNSVKANKEAKAQPSAKEPLSRVTSTNLGVGDSNNKTIDELEAIYRV